MTIKRDEDTYNPNAKHCAVCTQRTDRATFHLPPACETPQRDTEVDIEISDTAERLIELVGNWPEGIVESELESQVQAILTALVDKRVGEERGTVCGDCRN